MKFLSLIKFVIFPAVKLQCGFISGMLGLSKTKTGSSSQSDKTTKLDETQVSSSQKTGSQATQQSTQLLQQQELDLVKDLVSRLSGGIGETSTGTGIKDLATSLTTRAQGAETELAKQFAPIIAGTRQRGEDELMKLQTSLARQAGGSIGNTAVLSGVAGGRADLETQLAELEAQLSTQARSTGTAELNQALQALGLSEQTGSQRVTDVSQLLTQLKGAESTQTGTASTSETQMQDLTRVLNELMKGTGAEQSVSRTRDMKISAGFSPAG